MRAAEGHWPFMLSCVNSRGPDMLLVIVFVICHPTPGSAASANPPSQGPIGVQNHRTEGAPCTLDPRSKVRWHCARILLLCPRCIAATPPAVRAPPRSGGGQARPTCHAGGRQRMFSRTCPAPYDPLSSCSNRRYGHRAHPAQPPYTAPYSPDLRSRGGGGGVPRTQAAISAASRNISWSTRTGRALSCMPRWGEGVSGG